MDRHSPRETGCAILIDTQGRFLLQQRDKVAAGTAYPGKVGLFGGPREGNEWTAAPTGFNISDGGRQKG